MQFTIFCSTNRKSSVSGIRSTFSRNLFTAVTMYGSRSSANLTRSGSRSFARLSAGGEVRSEEGTALFDSGLGETVTIDGFPVFLASFFDSFKVTGTVTDKGALPLRTLASSVAYAKNQIHQYVIKINWHTLVAWREIPNLQQYI